MRSTITDVHHNRRHGRVPLDLLVDVISEALPSVVAIYAYGSMLGGRLGEGSDLDFAVLLPDGAALGPADGLALAARLSRIAGRQVDLVELSLASSVVLCKEVVSRGERVFVGDRTAADTFEMQVLSA